MGSVLRRNNCPYHGQPPELLGTFVQNIILKAGLTRGKLVVGLIYAFRANERADANKGSVPRCPHCMFLTTAVLAQKSIEDVVYSNKWWAQTGGVSLRDLNLMEHLVLSTLDFDLHISQETFGRWMDSYQVICREAYKLVLVALHSQIFTFPILSACAPWSTAGTACSGYAEVAHGPLAGPSKLLCSPVCGGSDSDSMGNPSPRSCSPAKAELRVEVLTPPPTPLAVRSRTGRRSARVARGPYLRAPDQPPGMTAL